MAHTEGMRRRRPPVSWTVFLIGICAIGFASPCAGAQPGGTLAPYAPARRLAIKPGQTETISFPNLVAGRTYSLLVTLESGHLQLEDRLKVTLSAAPATTRLPRNCTRVIPTCTVPIGPYATVRPRLRSRGSRVHAMQPWLCASSGET